MTPDQQQIVDNFLSSIDLDMKINVHYQNCLYDTKSYKWPSEISFAIMDGIGKAYNQKDK